MSKRAPTITIDNLAAVLQQSIQPHNFAMIIAEVVHKSSDPRAATTAALPHLLESLSPMVRTIDVYREYVRKIQRLVTTWGITAAGNDALANEFLFAVATAGFYEGFAQLAHSLLNRSPRDDEIVALVDYCKHESSDYTLSELDAVRKMVEAYCTKNLQQELLNTLQYIENKRYNKENDIPF